MANLTAHLVVQFADPNLTANVVLEIDDREAGYNNGKTTFYPGDQPVMLLFLPDGYAVDTIVTSAGAIDYVAEDTKEVEGYYPFANEDTASLTYPYGSGWTYAWLGTNAGALALNGQYEIKLPSRPIDPVTRALVPPYRVGVAYGTYTSNCKVYRLHSVPLGVSQVVAYFIVKKL